MDIFVAAALSVTFLLIAVCQMVKNSRYKALSSRKTEAAPKLLLTDSVLLVCDIAAGGEMDMRLSLDILSGLVPMCLLTSSVWDTGKALRPVAAVLGFQSLLAIYYLSCACGLCTPPSVSAICVGILLMGLLVAAFALSGIWLRVREVRKVIRTSTVWSCLTLSVDMVYLIMISVYVNLLLGLHPLLSQDSCRWLLLVTFLLGMTLTAMAVRVLCDSAFVMSPAHERTIVESMKLTTVEVSGETVRSDDGQYQEIYDRLLAYFEQESPYLNSELTINDIGKVIYSNKLYISRAISRHTGRNFCQFVNYYRVTYSMKLFREHPELKIAELASRSGFNSVVSFNMAFRLFAGENPSDWCRKARNKVVSSKK